MTNKGYDEMTGLYTTRYYAKKLLLETKLL